MVAITVAVLRRKLRGDLARRIPKQLHQGLNNARLHSAAGCRPCLGWLLSLWPVSPAPTKPLTVARRVPQQLHQGLDGFRLHSTAGLGSKQPSPRLPVLWRRSGGSLHHGQPLKEFCSRSPLPSASLRNCILGFMAAARMGSSSCAYASTTLHALLTCSRTCVPPGNSPRTDDMFVWQAGDLAITEDLLSA